MKRITLAACVSLLYFSSATAQTTSQQSPLASPAVQQEAPAALDAVVEAFGNGDAEEVMRHSGKRLDVTLFGMSKLFSRSQAGFVLSDFFKEHLPERLYVTETSGSAGNWFAAGRYWYVRGEAPLAIYFRLRFGEGEWELREVRISRTVDR